jgi:hypothetical protein
MSQNYFFEIPHELRRLAEDNVDRARQLYLQFLDGVSKAMAVWPSTSSDVITPGFKEVRERAVKFAKENADVAFALAGDVAKAKDVRELLSLQTRYVQSQMRWYADQTQEFGHLVSKAMAGVKQVQNGEANDSLAVSPTAQPVTEATKLALKGFSIEVETEPVTLMLETDKGPFSLEVTGDQLSKLVYALRFALYAEEPLQRRRQKQAEGGTKTATLMTGASKPQVKTHKKKK